MAAGIAALVLALAYPVGANLFLALGGVQKMFEDTDSIKVDFRRAWSFWPGRVHVEEIRVTMQDRNVQFVLTMPSVDVTLRLRELVERRFHATKVRGSGLVFRFRHRIEPESAAIPFVAAFPHIPGFEDPPLREAGPPAPPLDEAHYNLWTMHFEDVDVEVREIWAQMIRYQGVGRASGAFRLRPAKRLWVGPAELRLERGTLSTGPHEIASSFEGTITCKVDDFDVEPVHGMDVFAFISARADLEASLPGLEAVNFLSAPNGSFALEDGSGLLDLDVALDHGVFTGESRALYRTGHIGVAIGAVQFRLDGELDVSATGPGPQKNAEVVADLPKALLAFVGARHPPIELEDVRASLATTTVDVTRQWSLAGASGKFAARFSDLRSLDDVPIGGRRPWKIRRGGGDAHGGFTLSQDERLEASLDARAQNVDVCTESGVCSEVRTVTASGDMTSSPRRGPRGRFRLDTQDVVAEYGVTRVSASSIAGRGRASQSEIVATLDVKNVRAGAMGACPSLVARSATLESRILTPPSGSASADVAGAVDGASFTWGAFRAGASHMALSGLWDGQNLSAAVDTTAVRLQSSGGAPKGWQADVPMTSIRTTLRSVGDGVEGPLHIEANHVAARVGRTDVQGDIVASFELSSQDKSHRIADVSGVVQARRVAFRMNRHEVGDWWAELKLSRMHVDTRQNFDMAGALRARFKDALPALYVLASEEQIPKWTPSLLPLRSLELDLDVERFCRWTDLQLVEASGGPLKAAGRLQIEPGETRGALLLRLAAFEPVSMGLDFVEDYSNTSLFAGSSWLEEHLEPLTKAASEKHDTACTPEPPRCE